MAFGLATYPDTMPKLDLSDMDEMGYTETLTPEDNLMEKLKSLLPDPKAKGKPVWEKATRYVGMDPAERRKLEYGVDWGF